MSRASYAAWAKFDVEKELERVDLAEQRETQKRQQQKQMQAKESVESSATQTAQQLADILAAQAAVAALKAKKKKPRKGKEAQEDAVVAVAADTETEKAVELQAQAALFATKHKLLLQIMESRRLGDRMLTEKKNWSEAKLLFEKALTATKQLEELAPQLLEFEANLLGKEPGATPNQHEESPNKGQQEGCEHESACGKSCSHEQQERKKHDESLPKANDLVAIVQMFYKDVYVGIGTCDLEEGRLAAATEAFKEVLLRDELHLTAWLKRGEAFEEMDAPLLAMLHYNRITNLDPEHEKGKEALERVKTKLLTEGDASSDNNTIKSAVSACAEGQTFKELLERMQWTFEEANVLAVESFFDYSTTKYQVVLGCLEALRARPEVTSANDDTASPALRELEISCHLNIASGSLEMQRNYTKGLTHCEQALRLDGNRVITHFRMGQLYHALHSYEKALGCFGTAKALVPAIVSGQTEEQHKKMLATIVKETDKCEFDRNQYGVEYLRFLAAK